MTKSLKKTLQEEGLLGLSAVARQSAVCPSAIWSRVEAGVIPRPSRKINTRWYWTVEQAEITAQYFVTQHPPIRCQFGLTIKEMSRRLGINEQKLAAYCTQGYLLSPGIKHGLRKLYREEDEAVLRRQLENIPPYKPAVSSAPPGYFSISSAAKQLNVPLVTLRHWITTRGLPTPLRRVDRRLYYDAEDLVALQSFMTCNGYKPQPEKGSSRKRSGDGWVIWI